MIRAIMGDRKTQTRRVVKPAISENIEFMAGRVDDEPPTGDDLGLRYGIYEDENEQLRDPEWCIYCAEYPEEGVVPIGQAYGKPGDLLWVRETFYAVYPQDSNYNNGQPIEYDYRATYKDGDRLGDYWAPKKWAPSIHMPRAASRLTLELTNVRIERLQEIGNTDATAEGCTGGSGVEGYSDNNPAEPYEEYAVLWDRLNARRGYSWNSNPWVWVLCFKVHKQNIDAYIYTQAVK